VPIASQVIDFTKLRQDVARAVARICPTWLSSQRDDLVQAALMRIMQIVEQPAPTEGVAPLTASYLHKVAYSVLVDEIRRLTRRQETALDDETVDRVAITTRDPERAAASRQIGRGIQDCLRPRACSAGRRSGRRTSSTGDCRSCGRAWRAKDLNRE
jgi:RNA polymerase sigma-70 factor (ECF subfamily)